MNEERDYVEYMMEARRERSRFIGECLAAAWRRATRWMDAGRAESSARRPPYVGGLARTSK